MLNKKSVLMALLICVATTSVTTVVAGNFSSTTSYTIGDVMICFRKSSGANDLVIDAGPVATLTNLAPNTRYPITTYTGTQLAFVATNAVSWSAFTYFDESVSPVSIQDALFATRARTSINTQSQAWKIMGTPSQQNEANTPNIQVAGDMSSIWQGAEYAKAAGYNAASTVTAVLEPDGNPNYFTAGVDYADVINAPLTTSGNFNNDFQGNIENTTPSSFITSSTVARSDFYEIPYAGKVTFLGYFELSTNGSMTYVAYPSAAITVPVIKSIGRTNLVTSVSFTTGTSGTYSLRGTNSAGLSAAPLTWPAAASVAGDGAIHLLTDTTTNASKFYIITAQ